MDWGSFRPFYWSSCSGQRSQWHGACSWWRSEARRPIGGATCIMWRHHLVRTRCPIFRLCSYWNNVSHLQTFPVPVTRAAIPQTWILLSARWAVSFDKIQDHFQCNSMSTIFRTNNLHNFYNVTTQICFQSLYKSNMNVMMYRKLCVSYGHEQQRILQSLDHQDRQGTKTNNFFFKYQCVVFFCFFLG